MCTRSMTHIDVDSRWCMSSIRNLSALATLHYSSTVSCLMCKLLLFYLTTFCFVVVVKRVYVVQFHSKFCSIDSQIFEVINKCWQLQKRFKQSTKYVRHTNVIKWLKIKKSSSSNSFLSFEKNMNNSSLIKDQLDL